MRNRFVYLVDYFLKKENGITFYLWDTFSWGPVPLEENGRKKNPPIFHLDFTLKMLYRAKKSGIT